MKKIGIAISTYNKVDQVAANIKLIREYWNSHNDTFISVCCNDPASYKQVEALDIDAFSTGSTHRDDLLEDWPKNKHYMRLRQFECISKSLLNCEAEYIMHYHSDACAADVKHILKMIEILEKNNHFVAYRGRGVFLPKERLCEKIPYGDVDDHFLLFNRKQMINRKIFDQPNALNILKTACIESFLSKILKENFKKEELYHYLDMTENRCVNPFHFDEDRQFYHCSTLQTMEEKLSKEIRWK